MSQIDAALAVLKKARKPMSCREMVEAMAKQKLWTSPGGKTPDATLYAAILRDLRKGTDTRFRKAALQAGSR
ncbi:winged helix-turn-helix domain-containing protein [Roseiconus lacunae]|uniref:winged helix-turn-helix domain-containing protein n=1 Tax=Roseiconus lacunae TaxID=2605694 RepID=UPI001E2850B8|nr:winged helix-turn-helix domain-containing protein [Roseiconus lacunae]MCD0462968.1 winged helix-turn-helix domain-containing protein [Roseiconus lacunae]